MLEVDLLEDLGDGLELVDEVVVEALFAVGEFLEGDSEAVAAIELGDDGVDGAAAPGVEKLLGEGGAAVLVEGLGPGDEVDGHGVGDGAVAVEEVGFEVAFGERERHRFQFTCLSVVSTLACAGPDIGRRGNPKRFAVLGEYYFSIQFIAHRVTCTYLCAGLKSGSALYR